MHGSGRNQPGKQDRKSLVTGGACITHKVPRATCTDHLKCCPSLLSKKEEHCNSLVAGQQHCCGIHQSHGCSLVPDVSTNSYSNVEMGLTPGNLSQSSAHSRSGEPGNRQDVKDNRTDWQLSPAVFSQLISYGDFFG